MDTLDSLFTWFTSATFRGSLLILVVLCTQAGLRRVISPQWRYALWLPMLLVLLAPQLPQSRWSAENLGASVLQSWRGMAISMPSAPATPSLTQSPTRGSDLRAMHPDSETKLTLTETPGSQIAKLRQMAAVFWITGVVGLLVVSLIAYRRTWRRIVQGAVRPGQHIQDILVETAAACSLRKVPRLMLSQTVASPAVTGLFRPTLMLPAAFPHDLTADEVQLVLRHELIHLKRWDLPVNWLLCVVQALHWCNPIVWLAIHRIRADRESACDAQVLEWTLNDAREAYGNVLLKLEGTPMSARWSLGFIGIFEREAGIRTRLRAIAGYQRPHKAATLVAVLILAMLMVGGATRAQEATDVALSEGNSDQAASSPDSEAAATEKAARDKIVRKVAAIIIPRIEFREASIREAFAFLEKKSRELDKSEPDPAKRGVKFRLNLHPPQVAGRDREAGQMNPEETRLTVSLANIPLVEAVRYFTSLANLKFSIKSQAIEVFPMDAPEVLNLKEWMLLPTAGLKAGDDVQSILREHGITFPPGATASLSPDGSRLTVQNTAENLDRIDEILEQRAPAERPDDGIRKKLTTLIIPRLEFRKASLLDAVDFLRSKSVALDTLEDDPAKRGVNIVLKGRPVDPASTAAALPSIPGLDAVPEPAVAQSSIEEPQITLSLTNIPLGEALENVAGAAKYQLVVEQYAVVLLKNGEASGQLLTKEFKLSEGMVTGLALGPREAGPELRKHGITFPSGSAAIWLRLSKRLIMRNSQENHDRVDQLLASLSGDPTAQSPQSQQALAESQIIPTLIFQEATVRQVIETISERSAAISPEKRGVNVILDVPADAQNEKITFSLTNASVWDALRQIARLTELQLTATDKSLRLHRPSGR